jgi:NCAIR mutase (PurE)-related protein
MMANSEPRDILTLFKKGKLSLGRAEKELNSIYVDNLGFAQVDRLRESRKGFPEVVYGAGKTTEQILAITERILGHSGRILITRVGEDVYKALNARVKYLKFNKAARCIFYEGAPAYKKKVSLKKGYAAIVCAGTSDLAVAEEAAITARVTGCRVKTIYDIGVAGIHRLLSHAKELKRASVVVCVAGMEGALASVVGGMVNCPVIAPGVSVVNIDNGFGAGYAAFQILKQMQ